MSPQAQTTIFYGPVINPISLTTYSAYPRCLLAVNKSGNIDWVVDGVEPSVLQEVLASKGYIDAAQVLVELREGEFLMPGFIDTHTHAPQVPNMGTGGQYQLLDWLKYVTFPTESKFSDIDFARKTYESVVRRVIDSGTTTCCYYGTLHLESTKVLANIIHAFGQRAFVGKCNMNRHCPSHYVESSSHSSLADTQSLISHIRSLSPRPETSDHEPLVQPIITPRFAISCTDDLLSSLGTLAASDPTIRIQTHISENPEEVSFTQTLFPNVPHYAGVYDSFNLLRHNTILAHAVHLTEAEMDLIKSKNAGISHCPTSNFNLSSGIAPVGLFLDKGIKVGLGTDVSGGFNISILNAIQNASIAAKMCAINARSVAAPTETASAASTPAAPTPTDSPSFANKPLSIASLLYLATLGGAAVCSLDGQVGSFARDKSFDALLVTVGQEARNPGIWGLSEPSSTDITPEILQGWLERFFFCGDDRNIKKVYVQGKVVGGSSFGL